MAEYIDRAELMKRIENQAENWGEDYDAWQILGDIEDFPAADVRPVVRGEWIREEPNSATRFLPTYRCSVCGNSEYNTKKFCPNCGAKMGSDADGKE